MTFSCGSGYLPLVAGTDKDLRAEIEAKLAEDPTWRPWHEHLARQRHEDASQVEPDLPTDDEVARWDSQFEDIGQGGLGGVVGIGQLNDYYLRRQQGEQLRNTRGERDEQPQSLQSPRGYHVQPLQGGPTGYEIAHFMRVDDEWLVSGSVAHVDSTLQLYSLEIRPRPPDHRSLLQSGRLEAPSAGISNRFLSGISPDEIVSEVRAALERLPKALDSWKAYWKSRGIAEPAGLKVTESDIAQIRNQIKGAGLRRGRRGYPRAFYKALGESHVRACELQKSDNDPDLPVMELTVKLYEERYGPYPGLPKGVKDAVRRAEGLGFVTKAHKGKAGRSLGPAFFDNEQ